MKISQQAVIIATNLRVWAKGFGGTSEVVSDLRKLWEEAARSNDAPRVLVAYAGENIRGDFSVAAALHRVDRDWQVAITRGRGFSQVRGDSLTNTVQNAEAFYDSIETVRDIIRAVIGISEETPVDFKAIEPMNNGVEIVDGYIVSFSTANDLPMLSTTPDSLASAPLDTPSPQP